MTRRSIMASRSPPSPCLICVGMLCVVSGVGFGAPAPAGFDCARNADGIPNTRDVTARNTADRRRIDSSQVSADLNLPREVGNSGLTDPESGLQGSPAIV